MTSATDATGQAPPMGAGEAGRARRAGRGVLAVATALIVAQLAYRAWASFGSYWEGDDLLFIEKVFAPGGTSPSVLLTGIAGHVMPGGLSLTWLVNRIAPYDYTAAAALLCLVQLLASVGFVRLLLVAFGRRWGIIPPLVLYLTSAFAVQSAVWWATGIQALPVQAAFGWALASQITYLRTRRKSSALVAVAWVLFGLAFYEKTILTIAALAIVTLAYFTRGTTRERLGQVWRDYRFSAVANLVVGAGYLALYLRYGLNFSPGNAATVPIGPTADVLLLRSWAAAAIGGPLSWTHTPDAPVSFAAPSSAFVVLAWLVIVLVVRELIRSRSRSLRALALPGFYLLSDLLLVVAGRSSMIGPVIGYEYRYLSELSIVTAAGLAFAVLPLRGAVEPVVVRRRSWLLDARRPAIVACVVLALLGTWSTAGYFTNWHRDQTSRAYFTNLIHDSETARRGTAVVDAPVPDTLLWPIAYPANTPSHLLRPLDLPVRYVTAATDHLVIAGRDGHLRPVELTHVHRGVAPRHAVCANRVGSGMRRIPLTGVAHARGLWVRVGYIAAGNSAVTVGAGGLAQQTSVSHGLHYLYFAAGSRPFRSVTLGGMVGGTFLCTDDITVGRPTSGPSGQEAP